VSSFFEENKAQIGHGRQAAISGVSSMALRVGNAAFQIGSVVFLARLLSPEDYGLVGMVLALTGFAALLVDLGSRDAIVRQQSITSTEVSTLFWITLGTGCTLALVVAVSGPLVSRFYREPRLTSIALVSSLTFVTTALSCQHQALMRRALMFKTLVVIEVVAGISSGLLAIAMAFAGWQYWALVIRPITLSLFIAIGVWSYCRWVPGKPAMGASIRQMIRFGIALIGGSITDYVRGSIDRVAIGKRYAAEGLGQYQNGEQMYGQVMILLSYLHEVAVGNLSKVFDDLPEFRRLWAKGLSTLTFFAMPAFGLLAVTGRDLTEFLLGGKWATAGIILSILALRGIPQVMDRTLGWLHVPAGRADRWMRWSVFAASCQIAALFIGLSFGTTGVAVASVSVAYVLFLPALAYAGKPLGIGIKDVVRVAGRQFVGAVVTTGLAFLLRYQLLSGVPIVARVAMLAVFYMACYLFIVAGMFGVTSPLWVAGSLIQELLPKRLKFGGRSVPSEVDPQPTQAQD
jgi:PST family polysaccharide transporter